MTTLEQLKKNRQRILDIARQYGAKNIRIFGSVARGNAGPQSDVDFLVEMEPGRNLFDLGGLVMDLEDTLGCKVDVVTENGLNRYLKDEVLKEAVDL